MFTTHTMSQINTENEITRVPTTLPGLLLRLEGFVLFVSAIALYASLGANGWVFIALLFTPDFAALGYLINTRIGAISYNLVHTTAIPVALLVIAYLTAAQSLLPFILIWLAHIGMDRTVGYGLKYAAGFKQTHLNRV